MRSLRRRAGPVVALVDRARDRAAQRDRPADAAVGEELQPDTSERCRSPPRPRSCRRRRCGPTLPSSAIAMPSRLSKNQMLLSVAWATPPALRRFQLAPPSVLSQALPRASATTKRWALNGRKPLRTWTPARQRHRLPGSAVVLGAHARRVADGDDRRRIGEAIGEDAAVARRLHASATRRRRRR